MAVLPYALILLAGLDPCRTAVARLILDHMRAHPDCESAQILTVLPAVEIVESFHVNPDVSGWIHEGRIFINSNKKCKWTDRKIALFLIHELVHACGLCLNDSIRSYGRPICTIFGRPVYHSMDLTESIKKHFKERRPGNVNR